MAKNTSSKPHLNMDVFDVVFGDEDDPESWTQVRTTVRPIDSTNAGSLCAKHPEWGSMEKNPIPFLHAQVFYSLTRKGRYAATFDRFMEEVLDIDKVTSERVDPTQPATGND